MLLYSKFTSLVQSSFSFYSGTVSREYAQFCGLARALEILDGRWTLLVVRDLLAGPKRFTELQQGLPGIPSNVLSSRLRALEAAGVVARQLLARGVAYGLTDYGRDLEDAMVRLGVWGARAMGPRRESDFWSMHSLRLALRGAFQQDRAHDANGLYEMRIDGDTIGVTIADGSLSFSAGNIEEPDVAIETDPDTIYQLLTGALDLDTAGAADQVRINGDAHGARRFFDFFQLVGPAELSAATD